MKKNPWIEIANFILSIVIMIMVWKLALSF